MTARRVPLIDISNNDAMTTPVATGSRRKSGRAVKVPEKFIPDAPSSQQGHLSAKRKRSGEDVENDASDVEEEDEASDATAESEVEDFPAQRKKSKAKAAQQKPAAKKPKVNRIGSHEDAPAVKLPSRPKKAKKPLIADRTATGLYADVFTSGLNAEDVAGQFLTQYGDDKVATVKEMVNLVLKSAGCDLQATDDDIEDPDNVGGKLGDLQTEYTAQNVADYPLIVRAKSSLDFRENLVNFFVSLIEAMHKTGVMYEEDVPLIENVHLWFATMTSCTSRPFRHTATLVSLSVTTGLCAMVKYEADSTANIRRQLEGEKKKRGSNKGRLADYQHKVEASEQKQEFLRDKINEFFETVYVHRYRDIDPKIRTECVEAMGNWINDLPSVFLDGAYLRYMGWMLSDTHAPVRHEVIKQLRRILENEANHGTMRHFIERFRPRMIEIATQDSEPDVRASAVELASLIRDAGMLESDDIDAVGKLIFDSEQRVRNAVVDFLIASLQEVYEFKLEELGGEEDLQDLLATDDEKFDSPRQEWIKLKSLAEILSIYDADDQEMPSKIHTRNDSEFLNVSRTESRFTRAAQELYDKTPELKKWEMVAGYLLFDHSAKPTRDKTERALKEALKPKEREEVILLEVLYAVVKVAQAAQIDESEKATDRSKRKYTKAELLEAKQETSRRLAGLIPRLLKKYGANPKTVTAVLRLEQLLDLEIFQELRQSTAYAKLLDEISMQFNSHADRDVLTEAGAALLHSKKYADLEEVTENKIQSLWEDVTSTLRRFSKAGEISIRGSLRESVLNDLSHNLARLDKLASISNCVEPLEAEGTKNEPLPINILIDVVARGVFEEDDPDLDALEDEVVLSAIRSSMFYFMWKTHALKESISSGEEILDSDIDNLKDLQDTFNTNLISSLSSRATLDPVRLSATGTLLDLRVLFVTIRSAPPIKTKNGIVAESSKEPNEHLQSLAKEIEPPVQQELTGIFDQAEKQFAKKAKKRLAEPGEDEAPADLDSEPEDEEDDEEEVTDNERQAEALKAEQHLCELTGKLVLAILAKVIDASGPFEGRLRSRILRNKDRLGPNFKKVVEYLEEPKAKAKKSHKSKADQAAAEAKKKAAQKTKSAEVVAEEEEEEDDSFAEPEVEEGDVEDLRRRDLLYEDPAASVAEDGEGSDEDDVMGD